MTMTETRWTRRIRALAVLAATLVSGFVLIALVAYLGLGWQGLGSVVIGLVMSVVWLVWCGATGRLRWSPDSADGEGKSR